MQQTFEKSEMLKDIQIKEHLISLEEKLFNPSIRKSVKEVSQLLADDYLEFGSSEKVYNKEDVIESLQKEPSGQITAHDFKVNLLIPELALVTYTAMKTNKTKINTISLQSSIWKKTEGNWQIVFHQRNKIQ